jgi:hypothetical protein
MAQWKKLLVSGSNISQLNNNAGYIASGSSISQLNNDAGYVAGLPTGLVSSSAQLSDVVKTSGTQTIGGDKTFSDNVTISGDLTINGTTTTISTTNLTVEDKYIALATGTTSGGSNGGIIIVSGSVTGTEVGYGLAFSSNIQRWGFSRGTPVTTAGATISSWTVGTTFSPTSGAPGTAPTFGGTNNGIGNLHVDTATGDVYIYVESGQSSGGTAPEADVPQAPGI